MTMLVHTIARNRYLRKALPCVPEPAPTTVHLIPPDLQTKAIPKIKTTQKVVAEHYGVKLSKLIGADRKRYFTRPRQLAMYLAHEITGKSHAFIAKEFRYRDRSASSNAHDYISILVASSIQFATEVKSLRRKIENQYRR